MLKKVMKWLKFINIHYSQYNPIVIKLIL